MFKQLSHKCFPPNDTLFINIGSAFNEKIHVSSSQILDMSIICLTGFRLGSKLLKLRGIENETAKLLIKKLILIPKSFANQHLTVGLQERDKLLCNSWVLEATAQAFVLHLKKSHLIRTCVLHDPLNWSQARPRKHPLIVFEKLMFSKAFPHQLYSRSGVRRLRLISFRGGKATPRELPRLSPVAPQHASTRHVSTTTLCQCPIVFKVKKYTSVFFLI